jgi:flagellar hook-length control protein FliK
MRAKSISDATATAALASSAPPLPGAAQPMQPAGGPPVEAHLAAALDSPAFAPALANHVAWLVHEGQQHARLTLNPAELGPLTVKIMVDGNHTRVDFSADMAVTRSAIEASLPVLAAALHESGLTLAGGGVFDGQPRPGAQQDRAGRQPATAGTTSALPREAAPVLPQRAARGLVDLIA